MNREQSIDEILRQLKDAVSQEQKENTVLSTPSEQRDVGLSEEALKAQLKRQYGSDAGLATDTEEKAYVLDHEILEDITTGEPEPVVEEPHAEIEVVEPAEAEVATDTGFSVPTESSAEELTEVVSDAEEPFEETTEAEFTVEDPQWEETVRQLLEPIDAEMPTVIEAQEDETLSDSIEEIVDTGFSELSVADMKEIEGEPTMQTDEEEADEFPEIQAIDLTDILTDFEATEEPIEEVPLSEEPHGTAEDSVHESVLELMQQLGCVEELESVSEEEVPEELVQEDFQEADPTEYQSTAQKEEILADYRGKLRKAWLRVGALGMFTLIGFFYDTLPLWEVPFFGISDYEAYPGAYLLLGMQVLFLAGAIIGKPLWQGVKRIFFLHPDSYSMLAMMTVLTVIYDVVMVFTVSDGIPPVFHCYVLLLMLLVQLSELFLLQREKTLFGLYSSDQIQYTLKTEEGKHSVAEKMYRGGFDSKKKICSPETVEFPIGFFRSVREPQERQGRFLSIAFLPMLLLSILAAIVETLLHQQIVSAMLIVLAVWFVSIPLSVSLFHSMSLRIASLRLRKRGIALTGLPFIDEVSKTDVLVCQDLHLFRKCRTEDMGIVFYEQSQTTAVLAGLQLVYSCIGGPMADAFENVPQECRFEQLRIRRIAGNGIEAILNGSHVFLVGSADFMQRYGMHFPKSERTDGRATLCVSLDGKQSAKISAAYEPNPVFEMLVERLAQNGVQCVIETYDPMINTAFVASLRTVGTAPISVVHKNATDLQESKKPKRKQHRDTGMLVLSSRLKLAEAIVWGKRITKVLRQNQVIAVIWTVAGLLGLALCVGFDVVTVLNEYVFLGVTALSYTVALLVSLYHFPRKSYFTVEKLEDEILALRQKEALRLQKQAQKQEKKTKKQKEQEIHE